VVRHPLNWAAGQRLLDSPTLARAVRMVGEDEYRETGTFAAAGDNLVWAGRREKIDLEILELTFQNRSSSVINAQVFLSGAAISGGWDLTPAQIWAHPGFILMAGQQIFLRLSVAGLFSFEVRWRLYYGRKK
jgi:hypothetical protein